MAKSINELFNTARDNADNVKQILRVKRAIGKCEDQMAALLYELGCEAYEGRVNGVADEEAAAELTEHITAVRTNVKKLTAELNALNGKVECESCGKLTSTDFDFCPFCGAKLFDTVMDEDEDENETEADAAVEPECENCEDCGLDCGQAKDDGEDEIR